MKVLQPTGTITSEKNGPHDRDIESFDIFVTSLGGDVVRDGSGLARVLIGHQHYYLNPGEWLVCYGQDDREVLDHERWRKRYFVTASV